MPDTHVSYSRDDDKLTVWTEQMRTVTRLSNAHAVGAAIGALHSRILEQQAIAATAKNCLTNEVDQLTEHGDGLTRLQALVRVRDAIERAFSTPQAAGKAGGGITWGYVSGRGCGYIFDHQVYDTVEDAQKARES